MRRIVTATIHFVPAKISWYEEDFDGSGVTPEAFRSMTYDQLKQEAIVAAVEDEPTVASVEIERFDPAVEEEDVV